jgi:hypothetical protein
MEKLCEMLPWFVNQTLAPEARRQLILHLAHCEDCRQELPWLMALRTQLKSEMRHLAPGEKVPDMAELLKLASLLLKQARVMVPRVGVQRRTLRMEIPFGPAFNTAVTLPSVISVNIGEWLMAASQI